MKLGIFSPNISWDFARLADNCRKLLGSVFCRNIHANLEKILRYFPPRDVIEVRSKKNEKNFEQQEPGHSRHVRLLRSDRQATEKRKNACNQKRRIHVGMTKTMEYSLKTTLKTICSGVARIARVHHLYRQLTLRRST